MKKLFIAAITVVCIFSPACKVSASVDIVPLPVSVEVSKGTCAIDGTTCITAPTAELQRTAAVFAEQVKNLVGGEMPILAENSKKSIALSLDKALADEEYILKVNKNEVAVAGGSAAGVFYGLQSLRQLMVQNRNIVPCVEVKDKPCMQYRGAMLDVCRHIFTVDEVKKYIDIMAAHKINRFHWHLTDDQGWRIEIKKYPELTRVGSMRDETMIGYHRNPKPTYDGTPYGGFFTQEQVREVVAYAAARYITVIPEIEMPGHGVAALSSYPWLGCTGKNYKVWTRWGISKDVYCAGKESTFEFLENVLSEVLELFPSEYIHIGGDECPKERWHECPLCQKRMQENNLKNEEELQSYFVRRIEGWLAAHGRKVIGWDEIMKGGVPKSTVVMSWTGQDNGIKAAQKGNKVIMTPKWYCYLDYAQTSDPERLEKLGPTRYVSVHQAYRLDPYDRLTPEQQKNILGVQGNLWTEYIADFDYVQYKLLPRLAALSEVAWSYDRKSYDDFARRLHSLRKLYDAEHYTYAPYFFQGIE